MFNWQAIVVRVVVTFLEAAVPAIYINNQVDISAWQNAVLLGGVAVLSLAYNLGRQWLDAHRTMPNIEGVPQDQATKEALAS